MVINNMKTIEKKIEKIIEEGVTIGAVFKNETDNFVFKGIQLNAKDIANKISVLYQKEIVKEIQDLFDTVQFILIEEEVKTRVFNRILKAFVSHKKLDK